MKKNTVCITGHRPSKMPETFGYDIENAAWTSLKNTLKDLFCKQHCTDVWSGMALGVDTIAALAVLELKEEGIDIRLHCAIPCRNHSSRWKKQDRDRYDTILSLADEVVLVTDMEYAPYLMNRRNDYMVDRSDMVIAIWDGQSGGTKNCIRYAIDHGKRVIKVFPEKRQKPENTAAIEGEQDNILER